MFKFIKEFFFGKTDSSPAVEAPYKMEPPTLNPVELPVLTEAIAPAPKAKPKRKPAVATAAKKAPAAKAPATKKPAAKTATKKTAPKPKSK